MQNKWTAFLLSLVAPGAGQLYACHWSCLLWFLAVGLLAAVFASVDDSLASQGSKWLGLGLLSLASAEHAKRCLEPRRSRSDASLVRTRVFCDPFRGASVNLRIEVEVPRPPGEVWGMIADLPRFACIDPFHSRIRVLGPALKPGVDLILEHCAFGISFPRFGRLLNWHDGQGYAFSDLSAHGPRRGFPHVFFVALTPAALGDRPGTRLTVTVRGKWTARYVPLWVRRWWLRYVCAEHARLLRAAF
jgi:hypothetical protein